MTLTEQPTSVLVVDDSPANLELLVRRLTREGYTVTAVAGGREALDMVDAQDFDLVLLDVMMPGLSGMDVVEHLRLGHSRLELPVIMITALDGSEDVVHAIASGANDYVTKPLDFPILFARMAGQLDLKRAVLRNRLLEVSLAERNATLERVNEELQARSRLMARDLGTAAKVMHSLLPSHALDVAGVSFAWRFRPCDELGGDFLNVFQLDERTLGLYGLDVSGHGVASALMVASLSQVLGPANEASSLLVRHDGADDAAGIPVRPLQVVTTLNQLFPMNEETLQYFTLLYGTFDLPTRTLRLVAAGHPPVVLQRRGQAPVFVSGPGLPVGLMPDAMYEERELTLQSGDRLFIHSDGISGASQASGKLWSIEAMLAIIAASAEVPLGDCLDQLLDAATAWCLPDEPRDDMSVLALEIA